MPPVGKRVRTRQQACPYSSANESTYPGRVESGQGNLLAIIMLLRTRSIRRLVLPLCVRVSCDTPSHEGATVSNHRTTIRTRRKTK